MPKTALAPEGIDQDLWDSWSPSQRVLAVERLEKNKAKGPVSGDELAHQAMVAQRKEEAIQATKELNKRKKEEADKQAKADKEAANLKLLQRNANERVLLNDAVGIANPTTPMEERRRNVSSEQDIEDSADSSISRMKGAITGTAALGIQEWKAKDDSNPILAIFNDAIDAGSKALMTKSQEYQIDARNVQDKRSLGGLTEEHEYGLIGSSGEAIGVRKGTSDLFEGAYDTGKALLGMDDPTAGFDKMTSGAKSVLGALKDVTVDELALEAGIAWESTKFLADHPKFFINQVAGEVPEEAVATVVGLLSRRVPALAPYVEAIGTAIESSNDGGQVAMDVYNTILAQTGDEEKARKVAMTAGATSLAMNAVMERRSQLPAKAAAGKAIGSTETLLSVAKEGFTEATDTVIHNAAVEAPILKGTGSAFTLGAALDPVIGHTIQGLDKISDAPIDLITASLDKGTAVVQNYNAIRNQHKTLGLQSGDTSTANIAMAEAGRAAARGETVQKSTTGPTPVPTPMSPEDADKILTGYSSESNVKALVDADPATLDSTELAAVDSVAETRASTLLEETKKVNESIGLPDESDAAVLAVYTGLDEADIYDANGALTPAAKSAILRETKNDGSLENTIAKLPSTSAAAQLKQQADSVVQKTVDPNYIAPSLVKDNEVLGQLDSDASRLSTEVSDALAPEGSRGTRNTLDVARERLISGSATTAEEAVRGISGNSKLNKVAVLKAIKNLKGLGIRVTDAFTQTGEAKRTAMIELLNSPEMQGVDQNTFVEAMGLLQAARTGGTVTSKAARIEALESFLGSPAVRRSVTKSAPKTTTAQEDSDIKDIKHASARVTRKEALKLAIASLAHGTTTSRHITKSIKKGNIRISNFSTASAASNKGFGDTKAFVHNNTVYINTAAMQTSTELFSALDHELDHLFSSDEGLSKIDTLYSDPKSKEAMVTVILDKAVKARTLLNSGKSSELSVDQLIALKAMQHVANTSEGASALAKISLENKENAEAWLEHDHGLASELLAYFVEYRRAAYTTGITKTFLKDMKSGNSKGEIVPIVELIGNATLKALTDKSKIATDDLSKITNGLLRNRLAKLSKTKLNKDIKSDVQRSSNSVDHDPDAEPYAFEQEAEGADPLLKLVKAEEDDKRLITDVGAKLRAAKFLIKQAEDSPIKTSLTKRIDTMLAIFDTEDYADKLRSLPKTARAALDDFVRGFEMLIQADTDTDFKQVGMEVDKKSEDRKNTYIKKVKELLGLKPSDDLTTMIEGINLKNRETGRITDRSPFTEVVTIGSLEIAKMADYLYNSKLGTESVPNFMEVGFNQEELDYILSQKYEYKRVSSQQGKKTGRAVINLVTREEGSVTVDHTQRYWKDLEQYTILALKQAAEDIISAFAEQKGIEVLLNDFRKNPESYNGGEVLSDFNLYADKLTKPTTEDLLKAFLLASKADPVLAKKLIAGNVKFKGPTKFIGARTLATATLLRDAVKNESNSGTLGSSMGNVERFMNDPGLLNNIEEGKVAYAEYPGIISEEVLVWSPLNMNVPISTQLPIPLIDGLSTSVDTPFSKTSVEGLAMNQEETGLWPASNKSYGYTPYYGSGEHFATSDVQMTQVSLNNPALWTTYNPEDILKKIRSDTIKALLTVQKEAFEKVITGILLSTKFPATPEGLAAAYDISVETAKAVVEGTTNSKQAVEFAKAISKVATLDAEMELHTYNRMYTKVTTAGGSSVPVSNPGKPSILRRIYPNASDLGLGSNRNNDLNQNGKTLVSIGGLLEIIDGTESADEKLGKMNVLGFTKKHATTTVYTELTTAGVAKLLGNAVPLATGGYAINGLAATPVYNPQTDKEEAPLYIGTLPDKVDSKNYLKFFTDEAVGFLHVGYAPALVESITDAITTAGESFQEGTPVTEEEPTEIDLTEELPGSEVANTTEYEDGRASVASLLATESGKPSVFVPANSRGLVRVEHPSMHAGFDSNNVKDKLIDNYSKGRSSKGYGSTLVQAGKLAAPFVAKEGPINKTKDAKVREEVAAFLNTLVKRKLTTREYKAEVDVFMLGIRNKYEYPLLDDAYTAAGVNKNTKRKKIRASDTISSIKKDVEKALEQMDPRNDPTDALMVSFTRAEEIYSLMEANNSDILPLSLVIDILSDSSASKPDVDRANRSLLLAYQGRHESYYNTLVGSFGVGEADFELVVVGKPLKGKAIARRNAISYRNSPTFMKSLDNWRNGVVIDTPVAPVPEVALSYDKAIAEFQEFSPDLAKHFTEEVDGKQRLYRNRASYNASTGIIKLHFSVTQPNNGLLSAIASQLDAPILEVGGPSKLRIDATEAFNPSLWRSNAPFLAWAADQTAIPASNLYQSLTQARGGAAGSVLYNILVQTSTPMNGINSLSKMVAKEFPEVFYLAAIGAGASPNANSVIEGFYVDSLVEYSTSIEKEEAHTRSAVAILASELGASPVAETVSDVAEYLYPFGTAHSINTDVLSDATKAREDLKETLASLARTAPLLFNDQEEAASYAYSRNIRNRAVVVAVPNKESMASRRDAADAAFAALDPKYVLEGFKVQETTKPNHVYAIVDLTDVFAMTKPTINKEDKKIPSLFKPFSQTSTTFYKLNDAFHGPAMASFQTFMDEVNTPGRRQSSKNAKSSLVNSMLIDNGGIGGVFKAAGVSSHILLRHTSEAPVDQSELSAFRTPGSEKEFDESKLGERETYGRGRLDVSSTGIQRSRGFNTGIAANLDIILGPLGINPLGKDVSSRVKAANAFISDKARALTMRQRALTSSLAAKGILSADQLNNVYSDIRLIDLGLSRTNNTKYIGNRIAAVLAYKHGITDPAAQKVIADDYIAMRDIVEGVAAHIIDMLDTTQGLSNITEARDVVKKKIKDSLRLAMLNERVMNTDHAKLDPDFASALLKYASRDVYDAPNPANEEEMIMSKSMHAANRAINVWVKAELARGNVRPELAADMAAYRADPAGYIIKNIELYLRQGKLNRGTAFGEGLAYSANRPDTSDKIEGRIILGGKVSPAFSMILALESMSDLLMAAATYQGLSDKGDTGLLQRPRTVPFAADSADLMHELFKNANLTLTETKVLGTSLKKKFRKDSNPVTYGLRLVAYVRALKVSLDLSLQVAAVISSTLFTTSAGAAHKVPQAFSDAFDFYTDKDTPGATRFSRLGSDASALLSSSTASQKDIVDLLSAEDRAEFNKLMKSLGTDASALGLLRSVKRLARDAKKGLNTKIIPILLGGIESIGRHAVALDQIDEVAATARENGETLTRDETEYRAVTITHSIYPTPIEIASSSAMDVITLLFYDFLGYFISVAAAGINLMKHKVYSLVTRKSSRARMKALASLVFFLGTFEISSNAISEHIVAPAYEAAASIINNDSSANGPTRDEIRATFPEGTGKGIAITGVDSSGFRYTDVGRLSNPHIFLQSGYQVATATTQWLFTRDSDQFRRDIELSKKTFDGGFVEASWSRGATGAQKYTFIEAFMGMLPHINSIASTVGGDVESTLADKVLAYVVGSYSHQMAFGDTVALTPTSYVFPGDSKMIKEMQKELLFPNKTMSNADAVEKARQMSSDLQAREMIEVLHIKDLYDRYEKSGFTDQGVYAIIASIEDSKGPIAKKALPFIKMTSKANLIKFYNDNPGVGIPGGLVSSFTLETAYKELTSGNNAFTKFASPMLFGMVPMVGQSYDESKQKAVSAEIAARIATGASKSDKTIIYYIHESEYAANVLIPSKLVAKYPMNSNDVSLRIQMSSKSLQQLARAWRPEWSKNDLWAQPQNTIEVTDNGVTYRIGMQDLDTFGILDMTGGAETQIRLTNADSVEAITDEGKNIALQNITRTIFDNLQDSPTVTLTVDYDVSWAVSKSKDPDISGMLIPKVRLDKIKRQLARLSFTKEDGTVVDMGTLISDVGANYVEGKTGRQQRLSKSQKQVVEYAERWVYEGLDTKTAITDHDALEIAMEVLKNRPELGITVKASGDASPVYKRVNRVYINSDKYTTRRDLINDLLITTGGSK